MTQHRLHILPVWEPQTHSEDERPSSSPIGAVPHPHPNYDSSRTRRRARGNKLRTLPLIVKPAGTTPSAGRNKSVTRPRIVKLDRTTRSAGRNKPAIANRSVQRMLLVLSFHLHFLPPF